LVTHGLELLPFAARATLACLQPYCNWKAKYAGMTVSDVRRLKALEEENRHLKQIVAEQALDNKALKDLLAKDF
jgi:hypothetical protein